MNLLVPSSDGTAVTTIAGWWNLGDKSFQVTVTRSGNVLTIVVPAGLLSTVAVYGGGNNASWYKAKLLLDVRATIDGVSALGKTATVFKNTAKLSDSTGKDWDEKASRRKSLGMTSGISSRRALRMIRTVRIPVNRIWCHTPLWSIRTRWIWTRIPIRSR